MARDRTCCKRTVPGDWQAHVTSSAKNVQAIGHVRFVLRS